MDSQTIVTIISAIISAIAALATVSAVVVAIVAINDNRRQNQGTQFGASKPLLVPNDGLFIGQGIDHPNWLGQGNYQLGELHIRNMGSGAAFNVISVYSPPLAYVVNGELSYDAQDVYWTSRLDLPIAPGDSVATAHIKGESFFQVSQKRIRKHTLNAPPEPLNGHSQKEPMHLSRLVITYHDMFNRKHASIFDMVKDEGWKLIAFEEDIKEDLYDLRR